MDQYNRNKTITIKINREDRPHQENTHNNHNNQEDYKHKDSQKSDANYVSEAAASQESIEEESFDWILPEEDETIESNENNSLPKKKLGNPFRKNPKKTPPTKRRGSSIFFAVIMAILFGTSLGFILLKMVITEDLTKPATTAPVTDINAEPQAEKKQSEGKQTISAPSDQKALTAFIIQNGVWSNKAAAEQAQKKLNEQGIVSQLIDIDGKTAIYLGASDTLAHAKSISEDIKTKGVEVFAKEIAIEGKKLEGLNKEEKSLIEKFPSIYQLLTEALSSAQLEGAISKPLIDNVNKEAAFLTNINNDRLQNKNIIQMKKNLELAIVNIKELQKKKDEIKINQAQKQLLTFIASYKSL
ncbi:SPOR domain-containing protein [Bacillus sp. 03113]|uniref:SPOR domain-containing protein n=1 Tax=Bacillus sp. 03113 TaxID=2578211 RepID=UPI001143D977|nr:hypothetical protein [Bacillus sp. 03113]